MNAPTVSVGATGAYIRALAVAASLLLAACNDSSVDVLPVPAGSHTLAPNLTVDPDDRVVLSWLDTDGARATLQFATLTESGWGAPREVASGTDWLINWADFPSVVHLGDGRWAAHWLRLHPGGGFAYDVRIAQSLDDGHRWSPAVSPHRDGTATEHGFVSLALVGDDVQVVWLDGRRFADESTPQGMELRARSIARDMSLGAEQVVDDLVCDCCQTDAIETGKGLLVAYRDRSEAEVRDISTVSFADGRWSTPRTVHDDGWQIGGCPVNGPAIAARGTTVAVAWYTQVDEQGVVRLARSPDNGEHFDRPVDVDVQNPLGRVGVALLDDERAVVSWIRSGGGRTTVALRAVGPNGELGPIVDVADVSATRATGFPQLVAAADELVVAWTDAQGQASSVRSARVPAGLL